MLFPIAAWIVSATLLPLPADTPPALRIPAPAAGELRSVDDVVLTARMADGARAPATIILPQLENRREVYAYMRAHLPDTVSTPLPVIVPVAWVYIDEEGKPHGPELIVSTGHPAYDALAVALVERARFAPAHVGDSAVPVWVMLPVQIGRAALPRGADGMADPATPHFTPYTRKPELLNRQTVSRELVRNYPPELHQRGQGGTTILWLLISEQGNVERAIVKQSSGFPQLDRAAVRVAGSMLFSPAEYRGRKTRVWIAVPIVFATR